MTGDRTTDVASGAAAERTPMGGEAIDTLLAALEDTAAEFIAETAVAERELDAWSDEHERMIEEGRSGSEPDPRRALVSLRDRIAVDVARGLRQAGREWVAWWADVATYAAVCTAWGVPIDPVRVAIVDPGAHPDPVALVDLPGPSETDRVFVGLAARMASGPVGPDRHHVDMACIARDAAARLGLWLRHDDAGEVTVVDDITVEARRRRLWGDLWVDHRLPGLPVAGELVEVFTACAVPEAAVAEIRDAATAVDEVVAAELRLSELEALEPAEGTDHAAVNVEIDALCTHVGRATEILAAYARALSRHLPVIRASARARPRT